MTFFYAIEAMKQIALSVLIFLMNFDLLGQDSLKFDREANFLPSIKIVAYKRPTLDYTRKLKRQLNRENKHQEKLPELSYTPNQLEEYNNICTGDRKFNDSLRLDSTFSEYKWRNYLAEILKYPTEAYNREMTDSIAVSFEITSGQYLQNPILILGNELLLIIAVFDALKRMPKMKFEDNQNDKSTKKENFILEIYFIMI